MGKDGCYPLKIAKQAMLPYQLRREIALFAFFKDFSRWILQTPAGCDQLRDVAGSIPKQ